MSVLSGFVNWYLVVCIASVLMISFRLCIMFSVYCDCKARGIKDRAMWMVLTVLFPLICGIVYLCSRKNAKKIQPKICLNCGETIPSELNVCCKCASSSFVDYQMPDKASKLKVAKLLLIVGIICGVLSYSFSVVGIIGLNRCIAELADKFEINSEDDLDDFFNNYGFGNFEFDNDSDYDYDDDDNFDEFYGFYGDDFNSFGN